MDRRDGGAADEGVEDRAVGGAGDRRRRKREAAREYIVGVDRDEFVSFHAGKLSRSPRPMIYWATMW